MINLNTKNTTTYDGDIYQYKPDYFLTNFVQYSQAELFHLHDVINGPIKSHESMSKLLPDSDGQGDMSKVSILSSIVFFLGFCYLNMLLLYYGNSLN